MRTSRLLLADILESIDEIIDVTPASLSHFLANKLIQSHVLRHIAIIGEACSRVSRDLRDAHPNVPWRQIIDMRNIAVHVYHGINWERVHETARKDVPRLKLQIESILASLPEDK